MKKIIIALLVVVSLSSLLVFASQNKYPPDNAAVLYYSTFASYEPDHEMGLKLNEVRDANNRPVAKDVRKFVKEQGCAILKEVAINTHHHDTKGHLITFMPDLRATYGIFLIGKGG